MSLGGGGVYVGDAERAGRCLNCGDAMRAHCQEHLVPCCPGRCPNEAVTMAEAPAVTITAGVDVTTVANHWAKAPKRNELTFMGPDNKPAFRVDLAKGSVWLADGWGVDEAARLFWDAVRKLAPR